MVSDRVRAPRTPSAGLIDQRFVALSDADVGETRTTDHANSFDDHRPLGSLNHQHVTATQPSISRYDAMLAMMQREGGTRPEASSDSSARTPIQFTAESGQKSGRVPDIEIHFSKCEKTERGVRFVIDAPNAKKVQIAGEFTDWRAEPMLPDPGSSGRWSVNKPLPRGEYRYKFVIDGAWTNDPLNPLRKPNPFGGTDSILRLPLGPSPAA